MPANIIKHDVREGKGSKESLEKKWDKAGKAAEESDPDDKYALQTYIYKKMTGSRLNAATRLLAATKADKRAQWMSAYEDEVLKLCPDLHGKVNWNTATHLFNQGMNPKAAAKQAADHETA